MKLSRIIIAISCCPVLLAACTKTDDNKVDNSNGNNTTTSPVQEMLLAGRWQLTASTATTNYMGKDTTADLYMEMDDCEKDDLVQFTSDGDVTRDENVNICPGHPQTSTSTWKLMENDKKIAIYDSNPDTLGLEVTTTQLKLSQTKLNSSGMPVNYLDIYKNVK